MKQKPLLVILSVIFCYIFGLSCGSGSKPAFSTKFIHITVLDQANNAMPSANVFSVELGNEVTTDGKGAAVIEVSDTVIYSLIIEYNGESLGVRVAGAYQESQSLFIRVNGDYAELLAKDPRLGGERDDAPNVAPVSEVASPTQEAISTPRSTPKPTSVPTSTPTSSPSVTPTPNRTPKPTPTPSPVPTSRPTGSFDAGGNTSSFGIPQGLTGNISQGRAILQSRCETCHTERGTNYTFSRIKTTIEGPSMNLFLSNADLADLTAYLNRNQP